MIYIVRNTIAIEEQQLGKLQGWQLHWQVNAVMNGEIKPLLMLISISWGRLPAAGNPDRLVWAGLVMPGHSTLTFLP
eukprot:scaffold44371_cov20-Tisochrysis_lutea.AAC.1